MRRLCVSCTQIRPAHLDTSATRSLNHTPTAWMPDDGEAADFKPPYTALQVTAQGPGRSPGLFDGDEGVIDVGARVG